MVHGTAHSNTIRLDPERCQACAVCAAKRKCHGGAFRIIDKGEPPVLDLANCWGCFLCVIACPHGAVVRQSAAPKAPHTARPEPTPDELAARLEPLLHEQAELSAALPAHSIPPALLLRLDELDDEIAVLRAAIAARRDAGH